MKINILTISSFFIYNNFGSTLQAYALQETLKKMRHEPMLILNTDIFRRTFPHWAESFYSSLRFLCPFLRHLIDRVLLKYKSVGKNRAKRDHFLSFVHQNIRTTYYGYTQHERIHHLPKANAYICGSDQIWGWGADDMSYFFPHKDRSKCIAYAASGSWPMLSRDNAWLSAVSPYLKDFQAVGVRENEGLDLCKKAGANNVHHTIDPTLLLPAEHYERMMPQSRAIKEPYLLLYMLNISSLSEAPLNQAKQYCKEHKLRLVTLSGQGAERVLPSELNKTVGPLEFLNLIKHATAIITNSFHGSIFSLLFQVPYLICLQKGDHAVENARFYSTHTKLSQADRIATPETLDLNLLNEPPANALPLLTAWRQESYEFLRKNLEAIAAKQND